MKIKFEKCKILARAKDVDEAINEIRKFQDLSETFAKSSSKTAKHIVAKGENDLLQHLDKLET